MKRSLLPENIQQMNETSVFCLVQGRNGHTQPIYGYLTTEYVEFGAHRFLKSLGTAEHVDFDEHRLFLRSLGIIALHSTVTLIRRATLCIMDADA